MSKERLEEIKKLMKIDRRLILYQHDEWLIERVQELEELRQILTRDKSMLIEELVREQQQNKRYREKLIELENDGLNIINYGGKLNANELVDSVRDVLVLEDYD